MDKQHKCEACNRDITVGIFRYSLNQYAKSLCVKCQEQEMINRGVPENLVTYLRNKNRGQSASKGA